MIITSIIILFKSTSLEPSSLDDQLKQLQSQQAHLIEQTLTNEWENFMHGLESNFLYGNFLEQTYSGADGKQRYLKVYGEQILKAKGITREVPSEKIEAVKLKYQADVQKVVKPQKDLFIFWVFLMMVGFIAMVIKTYISLHNNFWLTIPVLLLQVLWAIVFCTGIVLICGIIASATGARVEDRYRKYR